MGGGGVGGNYNIAMYLCVSVGALIMSAKN